MTPELPRRLAIAFLLSCTPICLFPQPSTSQEPSITVDASRVVGQLPRFDGYTNTSLRFAPPRELASRVENEYGKPLITRVWLPLDDMWDYRDNSYHYNFQIGADRYANDLVKYKYDRGIVLPSDIYFEDYLKEFGEHSQYLLLNIRRYEVEVVNGTITLDKWKEVVKNALLHYKAECPNLRYIEALNEYHIKDFGGLTDGQYYRFYQAVYEVVGEVNRELNPAIPLEVGGPVAVGAPLNPEDIAGQAVPANKTIRLYHFLQEYAADPNLSKRLDFIDFHDYGLGGGFSAVSEYQAIVRDLLGKSGLNKNLPIFITEIGYAGPKPSAELNFHQATGISELFFFSRKSAQLHLFPWVLYHEPARQLSLTAFVLKPDLRMTPFGEALKMWSLQQKDEIKSEWAFPAPGLGGLASRGERRVVLQMWNDSGRTISASADISNLPLSSAQKIRVREYRIDSEHNNVFQQSSSGRSLEASSDAASHSADPHFSVTLEPYSLVMWVIDAEGK